MLSNFLKLHGNHRGKQGCSSVKNPTNIRKQVAVDLPWGIQSECSTQKPATGPTHKNLQLANRQRPTTFFTGPKHKVLQHPSLDHHTKPYNLLHWANTKPYNLLHWANTQSPTTSFTGPTHKDLQHPSLGQHLSLIHI